MRFSVCLMFLVGLMTTPVVAGEVNFADGRGGWRSTQCAPPQPPQIVPHDPERPADDLNARTAQHNQFVAAAQSYMNCISQEAQRDAEASGKAITNAAQAAMRQMQDQVASSEARLRMQQPNSQAMPQLMLPQGMQPQQNLPR